MTRPSCGVLVCGRQGVQCSDTGRVRLGASDGCIRRGRTRRHVGVAFFTFGLQLILVILQHCCFLLFCPVALVLMATVDCARHQCSS